MKQLFFLLAGLLFMSGVALGQEKTNQREFNSWYEHENLNQVSFPIGGIGAGMFCIDGSGAWSHFSIRNNPDIFNEPFCFAAIHIKANLSQSPT